MKKSTLYPTKVAYLFTVHCNLKANRKLLFMVLAQLPVLKKREFRCLS